MPQGSLFNDDELSRLVIELRHDEKDRKSRVQMIGYNPSGGVLASVAFVLDDFIEAELAAEMLAECARGWLYGSHVDAIGDPAARFRARRKLQRKTTRWGGRPESL